MELPLNFVLGQPTRNGRIYDPNMLLSEFNRLLSEDGHIQVGAGWDYVNKKTGVCKEEEVVGTADHYSVNENTGEVTLSVNGMSPETEIYIKDNPGKVKLTMFGFGSINESKEIFDFQLTSLFLTLE